MTNHVRTALRDLSAAAPLVALLLGACASRAAPLDLPHGHPADPSTPASVATPRAYVAVAPVPSAPAAPEAAEGYVCPMRPEGTASRLLPVRAGRPRRGLRRRVGFRGPRRLAVRVRAGLRAGRGAPLTPRGRSGRGGSRR